MNALEIKIHLYKNGLTISDIAREIQPEFGEHAFDTLRMLITKLFYRDYWNPRLADVIRRRYGIKLKKPDRPQTVREAVRRAA